MLQRMTLDEELIDIEEDIPQLTRTIIHNMVAICINFGTFSIYLYRIINYSSNIIIEMTFIFTSVFLMVVLTQKNVKLYSRIKKWWDAY